MKVLLAEDDPQIRETLAKLLTDNGFLVDAVSDGHEAMQRGLGHDYAVVILDFGLPTFSGEQVMERWKRAERRFPVIAMTGTRTMREDVTKLIDLGIDQYVGKPVDYDLLLKWVLSRANSGSPPPTGTVIRRGELELDTEKLVTMYKGKIVRLSQSEFKVLREIALSEGSPLKAQEIVSRCFDDRDGLKVADVTTYVGRIRQKFGCNIIMTAGGAQGYSLDA